MIRHSTYLRKCSKIQCVWNRCAHENVLTSPTSPNRKLSKQTTHDILKKNSKKSILRNIKSPLIPLIIVYFSDFLLNLLTIAIKFRFRFRIKLQWLKLIKIRHVGIKSIIVFEFDMNGVNRRNRENGGKHHYFPTLQIRNRIHPQSEESLYLG